MKLPKSFTKVTPLSKFLAMILFVSLPFIGFYLGIKYQKNVIQPLELNNCLINPTVDQEDTNNLNKF